MVLAVLLILNNWRFFTNLDWRFIHNWRYFPNYWQKLIFEFSLLFTRTSFVCTAAAMEKVAILGEIFLDGSQICDTEVKFEEKPSLDLLKTCRLVYGSSYFATVSLQERSYRKREEIGFGSCNLIPARNSKCKAGLRYL